VTPDRARALIGHWPKLAEEQCAERWAIKSETDDSDHHFWQAVKEVRTEWGEVWGRDKAATQLQIENEEEVKKQWNKLQVAWHARSSSACTDGRSGLDEPGSPSLVHYAPGDARGLC